MKRLRRYIFNGLALVSLLFCAATIILWVRSYWVAEGVSHHGAGGATWMLTNERGYLGLTTIRYERESPLKRPVRSQPWVFHRAPADPAASQDYAGSGLTGMLGLGSSGFARPIGEWPAKAIMYVRLYWCRLWIPVAVFALLPAIRLWMRRRARRTPAEASPA